MSYVLLSLLFTVLVHTFPRNPVVDPPDWGTVEDTRIPAGNGGEMEVYRITPDGPVAGTIVIAHGWGRNRDRMMNRARIFGRLGYITVLHSARDHGNSSKKMMMNSASFGEDLVTVLQWAGASPENPVLLYGHSAGSCGAAFAAAQFPKSLKALFLEGGFPEVREARLSLYRWINPLFGYIFGPAIVTLSAFFLKISWPDVAPCQLAEKIDCPVMIIHGALDKRFPVSFAPRLRACFNHVPTELFIAPRAGHSDSSEDPGFEKAVSSFLARHVTGTAADTH
jgi:pimeloyl-ACP methyl ester carboxylesterase